MVANYIGNAFSLQMLSEDANLRVRFVSAAEAAKMVGHDTVCCIGYGSTAAVFSEQLGVHVACDRASVKLSKGDVLLVGQLTGGRLPEGTTHLPDGFAIKWMTVEVV